MKSGFLFSLCTTLYVSKVLVKLVDCLNCSIQRTSRVKNRLHFIEAVFLDILHKSNWFIHQTSVHNTAEPECTSQGCALLEMAINNCWSCRSRLCFVCLKQAFFIPTFMKTICQFMSCLYQTKALSSHSDTVQREETSMLWQWNVHSLWLLYCKHTENRHVFRVGTLGPWQVTDQWNHNREARPRDGGMEGECYAGREASVTGINVTTLQIL